MLMPAALRTCGAILAFVLVMTSCSLAGPATPTVPSGGSRPPSTAEKTLVIGIQQEPTDFYGFAGSFGFGGVANVPPIALDTLVVQNAQGEYQPQLAAEQISLDAGTWRLNPDGTMDTIWKLRPNVRWHDGAPFTADDMVFTVGVRIDPEMAMTSTGRMDLVQSGSAPDPLTFVVHWSAPYANANQALDLDPLAKHLLEETYQNQKTSFANSPLLASQFVGQGPYRLADWQSGSQMTFVRFEDYYQGRPPLDRVVVRFLGDPNAMVANILAGNVDLLLPRGVGLDAAVEVQRRWAGTGNQVRFDVSESPRQIEVQFRPDVARPRDGLTTLPVRRAFYQAIDRRSLAELFAHGMSPPADSWLVPGSALRAALEPTIPQFAYDPASAHQLLAGAGWMRGNDGTLVNASSGERFETELRVTLPDEQKLMSVVANQWKEAGAQIVETVVPPARASDREYGSTYTGGLFSAGPLQAMVFGGRAHSKDLRSPANRWNGRNRSGYSNPVHDDLLDRVTIAIDQTERSTLLSQILKIQMGELVVMPLFWDAVPVLQLQGVRSHPGVGRVTTWNFFDFDKV
jgi:peptide/nickel transport system substrate-binding protein